MESSRAVEHLIVTDVNGANALSLPKCFSRMEIPVDPQSIPTINDIQPYPCMKEVARAFPSPVDADVELLIGANCPLALEPLQVIRNESCPLVAVRLRHGWTIFGNIGHHSNVVISHHISLVAEILSPESLMSMFEHEFNECSTGPDERGLSVDDKKFLNLVDNVTFEDNHYIIPLPLRDPDIKLPDNRTQAYQRLMWQKKKMQRNPSYHADYARFIDNLVQKGYCEKAPPPVPHKTWYLSHHGVYNPNKPGKIRVVYDCAAVHVCQPQRLFVARP
jgi:hypothetical protein